MTVRLRVLVVDDSAFMRTAVSRLLAQDSRFEVVGQAGDGEQALGLARALEPDLLTMDFNMPGMDGAAATRAILAERPVPIVMLSAHTRTGARETLAALAAGAVDFVTKPDGEVSTNLTPIRDELVRKLLAAASARFSRAASNATGALPSAGGEPGTVRSPGARVPLASRRAFTTARLVVIAASTGGPAALAELVPALTPGRDASVIVVQHLPAGFTSALAEQLAERAPFSVREASHGDELAPGAAFVAPGDRHLIVDRGGRIALHDEPPVHGVRPAADHTLRAAAQVFGPRVVAVVLTGMGHDGALGTAAVKAAGGRTIAQDRATSTVYGMPRAAVALGAIDDVAPLYRIAEIVNSYLR
ncbi:MAG: chemotaxis-specific protein-glutamate methyltransferase CheB [Polyangiaceae bacterium]|nr:chemotaxis-specific protein-glutamate methyltransferase CheB [Polyangiaceae bacterium]